MAGYQPPHDTGFISASFDSFTYFIARRAAMGGGGEWTGWGGGEQGGEGGGFVIGLQ